MVDFSKVYAMCFDVDSTVCTDEGIDSLAAFSGKQDCVEKITAQAMAGEIDFGMALKQRLDVLDLTASVITSYLTNNSVRVTTGAVKSHLHRIHDILGHNGQVLLISALESRSKGLAMPVDFSKVRTVCFDVDSTVCPVDGLDGIGAYMGMAEVVADITTQAMNGTLDLAAALMARLNVLHLTDANIASFKRTNPLKLTPWVERLFNALRANKIDIFLVSGGIYELVARVAEALKVPDDHVYANRLIYDADGVVVDFDRTQPTSRSDGKRDVVGAIKAGLPAGAAVLMVGDGMTDAAACPPADAFLGFGGVVARPAVRRSTPFFFESFEEMYRFLQDKGVIYDFK